MFSLDFIFGFSTAIVSGVFIFSSVGKILGCHRGVKKLCLNGYFELIISIAIFFVVESRMVLIVGIYSIIITIVGAIKQIVQPNKPCNCFGALSSIAERRSSAIRLALGLGAAFSVALHGEVENSREIIFGKACFFMVMTIIMVILVSRNSLPRMVTASRPNLSGVLIPDDLVVTRVFDRKEVKLSEEAAESSTMFFLITSDGCRSCKIVKEEIKSLEERGVIPIPILKIQVHQNLIKTESEYLDADDQIKSKLNIISFPTLLLVKHSKIIECAIGADELRQQLLQILVKNEI